MLRTTPTTQGFEPQTSRMRPTLPTKPQWRYYPLTIAFVLASNVERAQLRSLKDKELKCEK